MSENQSFAAVFSHIVGVDLIQTINTVKSNLLSGQTPFGFDLFKQHHLSLRSLQELIDVLPEDSADSDKQQKIQTAVESLVSDIGLPFLFSFAPSFDGRAESAAAVLNICDFISVCLKWSSQKTSARILELCLQSLVAFHNEHEKHSESASGDILDVLCAVELLCTALEIIILPENQNEDLLKKVFSASLSVLSHLEEKKANRLISVVIIKLTQDQNGRKNTYLQEVWKFIEEDSGKNETVSARSLQLYLSILCSMANFFFPLTDEVVTLDVRQYSAFWELVQLGLYSDNPAIRKRSIYLLKRIVDTCEKSEVDFLPVESSSDDPFAVVPHFWWSKQHQKDLSKVWEDIFLLLETLDEKQTHVIKPILPRMQTVLNATKVQRGSPALHTSWVVTLLLRAFHHESVFIMRWAAETVLLMDFTAMPLLPQGQLQFLTEKLLVFLQDLKLYQRSDGSPVGSCSSVGSGLKQFFASVFRSLDSKNDKVDFMQHVLVTLLKENWSSVPLVFITQGLSCIPPEPILDCNTLYTVRDIIYASLTTLENFTRGAIECFMTKTVLNLIDKDKVDVDMLIDTLGMMEREESIRRGTGLWSSLVTWLITTSSTSTPHHHAVWSWASLIERLHGMIDGYLVLEPNVSGNPLSESHRVTQASRLAMVMADCEGQVTEETKDEAGDGRSQPLLTATLGKAVDIVNSVNSHTYMPKVKADRAINLLLFCVKESKQDKEATQDVPGRQLCALVQSCWNELILFVKRRTLVSGLELVDLDLRDPDLDLDLVVFYADAVQTLGKVMPRGSGVTSLRDLVTSCTKVMETPGASSLQQVAAVTLLSAVALVVEEQVKGEVEEGCGGGQGGQHQLLSELCSIFSSMTIDCNVFAADRGGGLAHHGRQVCQYMMSQWQCLRVLLSWRPALLPPRRVLHDAMEAFSVSSGETDIPIMQCLELVLPQLVGGGEDEEGVTEAMEVAWGKVHEEIKSWSFWLKMEAYVHMVLQPPLLATLSSGGATSPLGACMTQVLQRFFEVGEEKAGLLNLVLARLCELWKGEEGKALAVTMVTTIVDACMFGTLHKKAERLWLDVCSYIETLGEECSVNEILSSSSKNDMYVRLMAVNFLSKLRPGVAEDEALARGVLEEVWGRYWSLAQMSTFRQFTNTQPHRHKHRLVQLLPLLDPFIRLEGCELWSGRVWEGLVVECHPSVRQNLEWVAMRLTQRFPARLLPPLWAYFHQFTDKRNISLLSLLHIMTRLGPELPEDMQEEFYLRAMSQVLPWTMAHHFNTRLHGQAAICQLWDQCRQRGLQAPHISAVESCVHFLRDNRNSSSVVEKLVDNYFYSHFHFLADYSMETLFYTLPRLSCLNDEEWMHPDLFRHLDPTCHTDDAAGRHLPLYNGSGSLAACEPGPWKMKATVETSEDTGDTPTEGDVQKKVIPWRLMMPDSSAEQEYSYRRRGARQDGLILVTSLINKLPNLGGLCRTSEIFGVSEFVVGNFSYLKDRTFQCLSVTAEKWIPVTEVQWFRLSEFLEEKRRDSYTLVGVEQTANSVELTKYKFPKKTLLVLGNEKEGIPPDLLQQLDVCVEIPQQGIIRSLNVHVSGALLIWEYTRQQMELA
ncbi:tRNA (guanosine(18)-2'-O)-methyltransferase TARBP1-like [Babylonia areolata]|uniref:tRNA (guanosine(18)-2'-O)-methyltransferase TARBP1-like n=1 Tax=Babylonia areolata TaxID=304850 RepID=UPI003FD232E9